MREHELTFEERSVWGECPVCRAPDGEPCYPEIGIHLGAKADGSSLQRGEGAHLARLNAAPHVTRVVPAD